MTAPRDIEDIVGLSADARRLFDWMTAAFTGDVNEALADARRHDTSISKWTHARLRDAHAELKARGVISPGAADLKPTHHHSTLKTPPSQLSREIAEALAQRNARRRGVVLDVEVDDSVYRSLHGAAPKGRGNWTFVIGKRSYELSDDPAIYRPGPGIPLPYAKAKAYAIAEAKRRGKLIVGVGP